MRRKKTRPESSLLHLVEEATELLRRADVRAWVWWLGGTVPFVCVLLHFWTDMSRAADAWHKLPTASLLLALSYWWMKIAHCVFSDHLLRQLRGEHSPAPLSFRAKIRFVTSQALIHFTTPWVLVFSFAALLPFGWVYAFYHNVTVLALSRFRAGDRTRDLIRLALQQSNYRQAVNHGMMIVLLVLAMTVWMNWWLGMLQGGSLLRSFTGSDNYITRNPLSQLSSTVFAATMAAAYLVVGPVVKALYAVRCFYGMSRKNGEDIAVAFRSSGATALALAVCLLMLTNSRAPAQEAAAAPPPVAAQSSPRVDVSALDKNIQQVLEQDAFQWRLPRESGAPDRAEKGWLSGFVDVCKSWIDGAKKYFDDVIQQRLKDFFKKLLGDRRDDIDLHGAQATPWADMAQVVLRVLLVVLALVLAVLLVRQWRRQPPAAAVASAAPEVNLESEQVIATQLPENEWLRLAQEKIDSGEFRLAMRALFLATLAHLGDRRLLAIARSKSNGDYVRELGMRARGKQDLRGRFSDSVRAFDRYWYGWHDVSRDQLDQFRDNHQHIITDATPQ